MDKKRARLDNGTAEEEVKIAAKMAADITIMMGDSLAFVEERLAKCSTLEQYKQAEKDIAKFSIDITQKMMVHVIKMAADVNELKK